MKKSAVLLTALLGVCTLSAAETMIVEAESGRGDPALTRILARPDASGGKAVVMEKLLPKNQPGSCWQITLTAPQEGRYLLMIRFFAPTSSSDSVFWALNEKDYAQFATRLAPQGAESKLGVVLLKKGDNTLSFRTRERGFLLDRVTAEFLPAAGAKNGPVTHVTPGDLKAAKFVYDSKKIMADLRPERHPVLFFTPENIAEARRLLPTSPALQKIRKLALTNVEPFLNKSEAELRAMIPPPGADICYGLGLDVDPHGVKVQWCGWSDPFHVVGKNGIRYPNKDYPDEANLGHRKKHLKKFHPLARAYGAACSNLNNIVLPSLADLYSLTGDKKYARIAAILLDQLAPTYAASKGGPLDYPVGSRDYDRGGRLTGAYYMASRRMMRIADAFDRLIPSGELLKPSQTAPGRTIFDNVAEHVLWNCAVYCLGFVYDDRGMLNGYADYMRSPVAVGLILNRPELAEIAMDPVWGLPAMLQANLGRDAFYCESSHMYSFHTAALYLDLVSFIESGVRQKWPGFRSQFDNPAFFNFLFRCYDRLEVGGHLPKIGDNEVDDRYYPPSLRAPKLPRYSAYHLNCQIQYAWSILAGAEDMKLKKLAAELIRNAYPDSEPEIPALRYHAFKIGRKELDMIRQAKVDPNYFERGSDLWPGKGLAILRGGRGDDRHGAQLQLGPQLNHGQFEALSWTFYNDGVEWSNDPGYFNTHYRFSWITRSVAHQQVVVDQGRADTTGGGAHLLAWKTGGHVQYALGSQPQAFPGLKHFNRLIAQVDQPSGKLDYWLDISVVQGGKVRDDSFHTVMTQAEYSEKFTPTGDFSMMGDAAKGMHFTAEYRLSGFPKAPFYWGLPGEGYPLLLNPAKLQTNKTLQGIYTQAGYPEIAARNQVITAYFPAEEGVEYWSVRSMGGRRSPAVPYLLRRDRKAAGTVFAKVLTFPDSSVTNVETVAAKGLARAYKITRKNGVDLWIRGALDVPEFRLSTDGEITLVRFDKANTVQEVYVTGGKTLSIQGRTWDTAATATGKVTAIGDKVFTVKTDRPVTGEFLLTSGSGLPAAWRIDRVEKDQIHLYTSAFYLTFSILEPQKHRKGWYEMLLNQGILRPLERQGTGLLWGKALYDRDDRLLGSITNAERQGTRLFVQLDTARTLPAGTVVYVGEVKVGDKVVSAGNFIWKR